MNSNGMNAEFFRESVLCHQLILKCMGRKDDFTGNSYGKINTAKYCVVEVVDLWLFTLIQSFIRLFCIYRKFYNKISKK